ncbi:MAG: hypothetical protein AAGD06_31260 [Acidobacteriota bacterium]
MNEILDSENHKTHREPAAPSTVPAPGLTPSRSALRPADCSCGGAVDTNPQLQDLGHVYAIGTVAPRFPTLGLEKELAQAVKGAETANLTDGQVLHDVLCRPENRYLAREMCWVFAVEGIDTYLLEPRSEHELDQLITTVRPDTGLDVDVVIGSRGSVAPPDRCNGLMLPTVMCDQVFTFDVDSFIDTIPRPASITEDAFGDAARELFFRVMQLTDNVGSEPEHRAINYLTLRYLFCARHGKRLLRRLGIAST